IRRRRGTKESEIFWIVVHLPSRILPLILLLHNPRDSVITLMKTTPPTEKTPDVSDLPFFVEFRFYSRRTSRGARTILDKTKENFYVFGL
ncbi:hypothetical protein PIB30_072350, partial [Stylosanthes scabra]|nr:hypothetical protein [Stylosanthes scabra]